MKTFQILTAAAHMPGSCWGRYGKIAVVEVDSNYTERIKMISPRARGVKAVIEVWDRLNMGTTPRCAFARAMREAQTLLDTLTTEQR